MLSTGADERDATPPGVGVEVRSLAEALRLAMIHLGRQVRRHDPAELSIAQVSGLASVVHQGPLGVGRLAELESLPSSAATRLTDKLEAAGLVVRRATPGDRRGVHVAATDSGVALLARYAQAGNAWLADRLVLLSEFDRRVLERAVVVLRSLASDHPGAAPTAGEGSRPTEELKA